MGYASWKTHKCRCPKCKKVVWVKYVLSGWNELRSKIYLEKDSIIDDSRDPYEENKNE